MNAVVDRQDIPSHVRRVVVKVGSAVLTGPQGLDQGIIGRLADQMALLHDRGIDFVLVSSGAVAAGKRVVKALHDKDLSALPARQAVSAVGQSRLMRAYDEAFKRFGKVTAQVLLTREDLKHGPRYLNILNTFQTLLHWRVIPVVNENDTVAVEELVFGDNDALGGLLLNVVEADLFVNLTSADGVYDKNPNTHADARLLRSVDDIACLDVEKLCEGKTVDGTGGMYSKLLAAKRAAQLGVPTLILSGRERHGLERVFNGEVLGTWIRPDKKTIPGRKFRIAYNTVPQGIIVVDAGAVKALTHGGKSLLPAGITAVEGTFEAGAPVKIKGIDGAAVGVGLANYSAEDLRRIMGVKSSAIAEIIGACPYPDAVHRDNLLLKAAVE
jgi:glutamate 5-kinase